MKHFLRKIQHMVDGMWVHRQIHKYDFYEECVNCQEITGVPKKLDIEKRTHYISGVGQLCVQCWNILYNPRSSGDNHVFGQDE